MATNNKPSIQDKYEKVRQVFKEQIKNKTWLYKAIILFIVFIGLILVNYQISSRIYGGHDFFTNWMAARLLFYKGISPYSQEAIQTFTNMAGELTISPNPGDYRFLAPLYSLFFYFPFSIISNFDFARAVWMTLMECAALACGYLCLKILNWNPKKSTKYIILAFSFLYFFVILDLINGNNLILCNLILLFGLFLLLNKKYETAGIVLALLTINIQPFIFPLIALFIYVFQHKAWTFFLWFLIVVVILGIIGALFIPDWPLQELREILRNPMIANLKLPGEMIGNWIRGAVSWIWNGLSLSLLIVMIFEWFSVNNTLDGFLWKMSLVLVLSPVIWLRADLNSIVLLLFPFVLVFSQWIKRDNRLGTYFSIVSSVLFTLVLISLSFITKSITMERPFPFYLYILPIIILIINLYWVRWWLVKKVSVEYDQPGYT